MDVNTKKTWSLVHKDARLEFQILALVTLFNSSQFQYQYHLELYKNANSLATLQIC